MTDYRPVDCGLHSEYELAIMQHRPIRLTWRGSDKKPITETVLPTDLRTHNHGEFLVVRTEDGSQREIRLDHITRVERQQ